MKLIRLITGLILAWTVPLYAEEMDHMHHGAPASSTNHEMSARDGGESGGMSGMDHTQMKGFFGPYSMSREASGTSWQPESSPHQGLHVMAGDWTLMTHGFAYGIYNSQGGPRGTNKFYSYSMLMTMAERPLGPGTLGLRNMMSLDPTMGKAGYPELLQTGETANGQRPLIDRQHPHDLFMELAASYSVPIKADQSVFAYFGYPGEPALGPSTFMHRLSGIDNPEAPITHHWLDSTHITFGVATVGYVWKNVKLEGSTFTGREPNQYRWDFDKPTFDSYSGRLSYDPTKDWSFQSSYGRLKSPEALEADVDQDRATASAAYNRQWSDNNWASTFAWGRNWNKPGNVSDGYLLESAVTLVKTHTLFTRAERVKKNELFEAGEPQAGNAFWVNKVSLGYIYDFPAWKRLQLGIGTLGAFHFLPAHLAGAYGSKTPKSYQVFLRAKLL